MFDPLNESAIGRQLSQDSIPDIFCWTKMGTEAGQTLEAILKRKELERMAGGGVFAWGIGSSLGGGVALARQLSPTGKVDVIFTPMKSAPKQIDVAPSETVLWLNYIESNGCVAPLPEHLLITSRGGANKRSHYALLCHSDRSLSASDVDDFIYSTCARNLASSNPIGASQVTSMVRYGGSDCVVAGEAPYRVAFRAALHGQGFLKLVNPVVVQGPINELYNQACAAASASEWATLAAKVRKAARTQAELAMGEDLFALES
ncbi:hypothetical protein GTP46_09510 [Duganella sp. FT135W]|uniref:Uncharacterized protein n=1 Tax=Duganella flavida TaxID=2692175 RepID=A0A6L8KEJ1_9BURK|nr:hypothetical protein [Duganella flavida]MYM22881.1 hypothetical protein [Duganella flavida]